MKEVENKKTINEKENCLDQTSNIDRIKDYNSISNSNFVPSNNIDLLIKSLSSPTFLGSIHLKKEMNPNYHQIEDMLVNEHETKLTRSIKNTIFNPITKILIISAILFNLVWFILKFLF
jgi:hypothetical protein